MKVIIELTMTSMFSFPFSVCLSVFIPKKDARLTENSYDTDKDLVIQKVTDTSKTLDKVMKLVTYLNKSEEDSLRLLNFDFLLVNSSK